MWRQAVSAAGAPIDDMDERGQMMKLQDQPSAAAASMATEVSEPRRVRQVTLPSAPRAAGLARQVARDALASWGLERLEDIAILLVSELVGNAVQHARHGGSELRLRMTDMRHWLRIEVSDADPRPPRFQWRPGPDGSGFGLVLVDALAARWGVDQAAVGKTVWAELGTCQSDACDSRPLPDPATTRPDRVRQHQSLPPGLAPREEHAAPGGDARYPVGNGVILGAEAASLCCSAAALIRGCGWDPLAETCNPAAGALPLDVAILAVADARGYGQLNDIVDVVLTHIAGALYAAGEVARQTLVHDLTDVALAWEAQPGRTAVEVLAVLGLTASILNAHRGPHHLAVLPEPGRLRDVPRWPGSVRECPAPAG